MNALRNRPPQKLMFMLHNHVHMEFIHKRLVFMVIELIRNSGQIVIPWLHGRRMDSLSLVTSSYTTALFPTVSSQHLKNLLSFFLYLHFRLSYRLPNPSKKSQPPFAFVTNISPKRGRQDPRKFLGLPYDRYSVRKESSVIEKDVEKLCMGNLYT